MFPGQLQGSYSFLGCRLRTRLTISVLPLMAVGAATVPHRVSEKKEVSQKSLHMQIMAVSIFSVRNLT